MSRTRKFFYGLLLLSFLLSLLLVWKSSGIKFDNSIWLNKENPHRINKAYLYDEFTRGKSLILAIDLQEDFFQPQFISLIRKVSRELEQIEDVLEVTSPLSATTVLQTKATVHIFSFETALEKKIIPSLQDYKERFTNSNYYGVLLSKDYSKLAIEMRIDAPPGKFNQHSLREIYKEINRITDQHLSKFSTHIAGEGALHYALFKYIRSDAYTCIPMAFALIFLLLYLVFRQSIRVLLTAYTALLTLVLTFVVFVIFDYPMTAIGVSLPVLMLVISIADAIHIFNRWDGVVPSVQDHKLALKMTFQQTWVPCLFTSVTTAVGFGAFYFSEVKPLSQLGQVSFITIMLSYVIILGHLWLFLYLFGDRFLQPKSSRSYDRLLSLLNWTYTLTSRYYRWILAFCVLVTVASIYILSAFARTETNFLDVFFKKESKVYKDFAYVDKYLGGTGAVDILVSASAEEEYKRIELMNSIKVAEEVLEKDKQVQFVRSYLNPIRMIHKELAEGPKKELPQNENQLAQEILFLEFSRGAEKNDILSPYVSFDYKNLRIHLQMPNLNSSEALKIKNFIEENLKLGLGQKYTLSGTSIFSEALGQYIVDTQFLSILITLSLVWILLLIQFGFKLSIVGVIANSLPLLITTTWIAYLNVPFDFATVLIFSASFGLCVDDTIHFLHYYHLQKKQSLNFDSQIRNVIRVAGPPIFSTSVLFSLGFITFLASNTVLMGKFGTFTVISLVLAFFANVIFLPALLKFVDTK